MRGVDLVEVLRRDYEDVGEQEEELDLEAGLAVCVQPSLSTSIQAILVLRRSADLHGPRGDARARIGARAVA